MHKKMLKEFCCNYIQERYLSENIDFSGLPGCLKCDKITEKLKIKNKILNSH